MIKKTVLARCYCKTYWPAIYESQNGFTLFGRATSSKNIMTPECPKCHHTSIFPNYLVEYDHSLHFKKMAVPTFGGKSVYQIRDSKFFLTPEIQNDLILQYLALQNFSITSDPSTNPPTSQLIYKRNQDSAMVLFEIDSPHRSTVDMFVFAEKDDQLFVGIQAAIKAQQKLLPARRPKKTIDSMIDQLGNKIVVNDWVSFYDNRRGKISIGRISKFNFSGQVPSISITMNEKNRKKISPKRSDQVLKIHPDYMMLWLLSN